MYLLKHTEHKLDVVTLPNCMKLAIIRCDQITAPILSISVATGYYNETNQCYGFAHLLEHMIFHRSKHFDSSEALEKHISQFSGYINGWTHACHTNFHLSCATEGFLDALSMLVDKIAHPSLCIADIKTEITAIDEEYRLKLDDPVRGLFSVKKALANPDHPFHRFSVGNKDTFEQVTLNDLQAQLRQHHRDYFHSANITATLMIPANNAINAYEFSAGKNVSVNTPIVTATEKALTHIIEGTKALLGTNIAHGLKPKAKDLPSLYLPEMTHKWVNVHLRHSHTQLILCWLVNKSSGQLDSSALGMLKQLIESKHKQGLYDTLNEQRLVRSVSFTGGIEQSGVEELQLHITLSTKGKTHRSLVLGQIQSYLVFLSQSQLANWRFEEREKQSALLHQYAKRYDPVDACIQAAQSLHNDAADEQQGPYSFHQAKARISHILALMTETPHHAYFISDNEGLYQTTDFYHVPYSVEDFPSVINEHKSTFALAPQNPYLPSQLFLVTPEMPTGNIETINRHGVLLKFAQVLIDKQPKGDCYISLNSLAMCDSLSHSMSKKVWVEGFTEYIQKRFYQADEAGISFRVYGHQHGVAIHTTGFSEKQLLLAIEIVNCMVDFSLTKDEFEHIRSAIIKRLSTRLLQKPINQLFANLNTLVQGESFSIAQQIEAVEALSFKQLNEHQTQFFDHNCVEALLVGNWRRYGAQKMHQQLQSRLTAKAVWTKPNITAHIIEQACMPALQNVRAEDTALVLYQQFISTDDASPLSTEEATALCLMLEHILGPHVFLRLRNDKQLAYLVGVGYKPINAQPGLAIYLQSSKAPAAEIYQAICDVIKELLDDWERINSDLAHIKVQVAKQCEPLNQDVSMIARRLWANYEHENAFFYNQGLQDAVAQVSSEDIQFWLGKLGQANTGQVLLTNDSEAPKQESLCKFAYRPAIK